VDLELLEDLSNVNDENIWSFLRKLIQKWVPKVREAMKSRPDLTDLTAMIRIGGKSLDDIFGEEKMKQFRTAAKGFLSSIPSVEQKLKMLLDIVIILCLLACIYDNFTTLHWSSVLLNSETKVTNVKSHVKANEQVYINLLGVLRLLVSNLEVFVITVASRVYYFDP